MAILRRCTTETMTFEIPVGERFYVFSIAVGQDNVTLALLSAQLMNNKKGSGTGMGGSHLRFSSADTCECE